MRSKLRSLSKILSRFQRLYSALKSFKTSNSLCHQCNLSVYELHKDDWLYYDCLISRVNHYLWLLRQGGSEGSTKHLHCYMEPT